MMNLLKRRKTVCVLTIIALAATLPSTKGRAQETSETKPADARAPEITETIHLQNATSTNDLNDVQTALRNSFVHTRMYGVAGQYALTIRGSAEDVEAAKKMIAELDRPKRVYRVTYTVANSDNGKRTGEEHYSILVTDGGKTNLRQGNRVPLMTGVLGEGKPAGQTSQVQYIDVGINIDASIEDAGLRTKFEQTAVADEKSGFGAQDPVIRQAMLEGVVTLRSGKPMMLGSIDIPGTTQHKDVEVSTELLTQ